MKKLIVTTRRVLTQCILWVLCLAISGPVIRANAQESQPNEVVRLMLLIDTTEVAFEFVDPLTWFDDQVVGILLTGKFSAGNSKVVTQVRPDFNGSYVQRTDAVLITRQGRMLFARLFVADLGLPEHGFLSPRDVLDLYSVPLDDSSGTISPNINGNWQGFFLKMAR